MREKVWPGRTALTVQLLQRSSADAIHDDIEALRTQLIDGGIDSDGPAGAALAVAVSPSATAVSAPAARELRRNFFMVVSFSCS